MAIRKQHLVDARPTPQSQIARVVKVYMHWRGLDQQTLAARIGMEPSLLSKRLRSIIDLSVDELFVLAEALDVEPAKLLQDPASMLMYVSDDAGQRAELRSIPTSPPKPTTQPKHHQPPLMAAASMDTR
jgi:hypothetical protein